MVPRSPLFVALSALGAALAATTGVQLVPRAAPWPVPTAAQLKYGGTISGLIHFNMVRLCVSKGSGVSEPFLLMGVGGGTEAAHFVVHDASRVLSGLG